MSQAENCRLCGVAHKDANNPSRWTCLEESIQRMFKLVVLIGRPSKCRACGVDIWFIRHLSGKEAPYTARGLNHFIDCPAAKEFKK